jgi:hypothetical protein
MTASDGSWDRAARRWAASAAPALAWAGVGVPFDVIRTRLQTTSTAQFRSAKHCLEHTVRSEGVLALWKGLTPQILISLPSSTLLFGTYQQLRPVRPHVADDAAAWRSFYAGVFGAGFGSGVSLTALQNPLDVWRTRLQTTYLRDGPPPPPPTNAKVAWRGVSMTAVRNLPGNGVFFLVHETLDVHVRERISGDSGLVSPAVARMLCGGVTGVVYNLLLSPFDVVRARLMATTSGSVMSHARDVLREHGALRGFFRGADVTVLKAFPMNAIGFLALAKAKWLLGVDSDESGAN